MSDRRSLFGYGLERCGVSAVYHIVCERADFCIRCGRALIRCGRAVVYLPGSGKDIRREVGFR